jgi:predicted phage terminase large subunit-like protein
MRSASNPGNVGHDWVKMRYVEPRTKDRPFVPARLADNPYLDREGYQLSLSELDPFTRRQLLDGDWTARNPSGKFRREWLELVEVAPEQAERCRYWDLAATAPKPGTDPDWTAGARVSVTRDGIWHVEDMRRMRGSPLQVEQLVRQTAELDGRAVPVWIEQEPGSSGKNTIDHYVRNVLRGYTVRGHSPTGPKDVRANPVSSQAEAGNVKLVRGGWVPSYLDELDAFSPDCSHDDQVDATSGAFAMLTRRGFSAADAIRAMEVS